MTPCPIKCGNTEAERLRLWGCWSGATQVFELEKPSFRGAGSPRCSRAFTFVDDLLAFGLWSAFHGPQFPPLEPEHGDSVCRRTAHFESLSAPSLTLLPIKGFSWVEGFWNHPCIHPPFSLCTSDALLAALQRTDFRVKGRRREARHEGPAVVQARGAGGQD